MALITYSRKNVIGTIDVIYYCVIWTDNGSMLPETNTRRQEGKYLMIKVLQGYILKLLLHSVNSGLILYRTGNMPSTILLSFVASSSLLPCGVESIHPPMLYYISPYVVYNIYDWYLFIIIIFIFYFQKWLTRTNINL